MREAARWDRWLAIGLLLAGLGGLVGLPLILSHFGTSAANPKIEGKVSQRSGASIKLGAKLAELYGIKAEAARSQAWQSKQTIYGRVVPNAHATAELRAPFAGTIQAGAKGWPGIGAQVALGQELAVVQARFSPQERLELQSKLVEAQEKVKGAEEVVRVQQDRVQRLSSITGIVPGGELDLAKVQLAEAKALFAGATAQAQLWQRVFNSLDKQLIAVELPAPLDGEVVDVGVRPGTAVEAGAILLKIVDFRKVLARLDVPAAQGLPPDELDIALPTSDREPRRALKARRIGPAPNIDSASQYAGYFYEADATNREGAWRPGLFVNAQIPDPKSQSAEAAAVLGSAVLYHQGRALVYVQLSPGRFERREVQVLGRDGDNALLGRGVRPGELVVTQHAQALLSEEFRGDADDD